MIYREISSRVGPISILGHEHDTRRIVTVNQRLACSRTTSGSCGNVVNKMWSLPQRSSSLWTRGARFSEIFGARPVRPSRERGGRLSCRSVVSYTLQPGRRRVQLSERRRRRQRRWWLSLKRPEACECCGSFGVRRYIYAARVALERQDKSACRYSQAFRVRPSDSPNMNNNEL